MADIKHTKNKKINGKRRKIAEMLHSDRKSGSANIFIMKPPKLHSE